MSLGAWLHKQDHSFEKRKEQEGMTETRPKKPWKSICGARTRRGHPCQCKPVRRGRCRLHGGASTGPTTTAGKAQSTENLKRARDALNSPLYSEARRERALKGWKTRRRTAERRQLIEAGGRAGMAAWWFMALEKMC
jgi:hypothetical protein